MRERGLGFRGGMSEYLCEHGKKARWRKDVWRGVSAFMCAFLLFAVFVVPAASHEKLASEDYNTLQIYGNANEDDTVDMRDVTYIKLVIFGKKPETEFSDANYDGRVSMLDVVQTKLIIVGKEAKLTIVDSADRIVTVKKPVERIVIGTPSWMYDAVWIIGAQDEVVGVTKEAKERFAKMLPGIQDKQSIGSYRDPDFEVILSLEPDIVFGERRYVEGLKDTGIPVITMKFREIEKVDSEFRILAKILGKEERVESFIGWKNGYIDQLKEKTKEIESKVRVYAEWSDVPLCTGSRGSGVHDVIELAGGYNIANDLHGPYPQVSPEWVLDKNPEVIIFPAFADFAPTDLTGYHINSHENAKQFIEEARNRIELNGTDAVKNNRVYVLDGHYTESAVKNFIGAFYCAKWFYPELFKDLKPEEIHREYFEEWLGVPYKGIWAYPLIGG